MHYRREFKRCIWAMAMSNGDSSFKRTNTLRFRHRSEVYNLDEMDAAILRELMADARVARAELARRVGLSPPSVGERVRRLEDAGVITGYHAAIDPVRLGYALTILIRARPSPGRVQDMIGAIAATPQIVRCERVSGDDCFVAWAHVHDVTEMEAVIDGLVPYGATNSSIVQSSPVAERGVELIAGHSRM